MKYISVKKYICEIIVSCTSRLSKRGETMRIYRLINKLVRLGNCLRRPITLGVRIILLKAVRNGITVV